MSAVKQFIRKNQSWLSNWIFCIITPVTQSFRNPFNNLIFYKKTFIVIIIIIIIIIIINVEKSWEYFFLGFLGGINWKNSNDCYICYSYIYCYIYIIYIKLLNGIVVYIVIETS